MTTDVKEVEVVVRLTYSQARALAYASSFGVDLPLARWPDQKYLDTAKRARNELLIATAKAERT